MQVMLVLASTVWVTNWPGAEPTLPAASMTCKAAACLGCRLVVKVEGSDAILVLALTGSGPACTLPAASMTCRQQGGHLQI